MAKFLILCPTFDHADTLFASIGSARAQTFAEWEMAVIGDGAPDRTFAVLDAITADDPRIRVYRNPKSPRLGEDYRDPVIRESRAEFVCHLADDDLFAPNHLTTMLALLEQAEWANQAELRITPDGRSRWMPVNLGGRRDGTMVGISYVAYRREAYLRLPHGWRTMPVEDGPSDRVLYRSFFDTPGVRVASSAISTALKFAGRTGSRIGLTPDQRLAELMPWLARSAEPGLADRLRGAASVQARIALLFAQCDAEECATVEEAFARAGLAPAPPDARPEPAIDGVPMVLPLTHEQRREATLAHLMLRAYGPSQPAGEARAAVLAAHRGVKAWKQSIQALAAGRMGAAIRAAADFRTARPEAPEAYVLSAELLTRKRRTAEAAAVIGDLASRWPDHAAIGRLRTLLTETIAEAEAARAPVAAEPVGP